MSDMKPIGWVIVTPRGKALPLTLHYRQHRPRKHFDYAAWEGFADAYGELPDFRDLGYVPSIIRKARRLGYRAERVYVKGGN